jgi:hypothetical protein
MVQRTIIAAALLWGAACFFASIAHAGSCCGGGGAVTLVLPKNATAMLDTSLDVEQYDGFWTKDGTYLRDQPGTDLRQYRLNIGYALRLAPRWQASLSVPYVWNKNNYSGISSQSEGMGDSTLSLWYEAFKGVMCRWGWNTLELADLKPDATFGVSLTIPTGISPYDDVKSSFDITGRGFYRLDGNVLLDKTIFPWSASLFMSYGTHIERPVNREYGEYVQPYHKKLGDRAVGTLAVSYVSYLDFHASRNIMTYTASFAEVWEGEGTINGDRDPTSGLRKTSVAGTVACSTLDRVWTIKTTWNHSINKDGWGNNTPASDIYSLGVTYVFE